MTTNDELLQIKLAKFNARQGPRTGDFLRLPEIHPKLGRYTRLTHDWGDTQQTGGMGGSYYLGNGWLSYSGGLDPGIKTADITPQIDEKPGSLWFFDKDISGAGRGVNYTAPMRVFGIRDGANLDGIDELRCPFSLCVLDAAGHARTCNYWFTITKHAISETAFTTEAQLRGWLASNGMRLTQPLTQPGERSWQSLAYAETEAA